MEKKEDIRFSGKLMKERRTAAGVSRARLSIAMDSIVGPHTIENYESGMRVPTVNTALRIADALGIKLKDLLDNAKG